MYSKWIFRVGWRQLAVVYCARSTCRSSACVRTCKYDKSEQSGAALEGRAAPAADLSISRCRGPGLAASFLRTWCSRVSACLQTQSQTTPCMALGARRSAHARPLQSGGCTKGRVSCRGHASDRQPHWCTL